MKLRPYQNTAVEDIATLINHRGIRRVLCIAPTGAGKCLGIGTPVLRYDGRIVPVEDVRQGDLLMGPGSAPRLVLSTTRARGPLYRIIPVKGEPWVCNDVHVLTLVHTETGAIVDIDLQAYLAQSKHWRHCHKLAAPIGGVDFPPQAPSEIDPYFMGVWFGDGTKRDGTVAITKPDQEIFDLVSSIATQWGLRVRTENEERCPTHFIVGERGAGNPLLQALRRMVLDPTTIGNVFRTASRADREAFFAGIIDTDGYANHGGVEVVQKQQGIADGIAFIARSLGFRAIESDKVVDGTTYHRLSISGDFSELPIRIARKRSLPRQQKKTVTRTGFSVEPIGDGEYAGFELDGDGRFLLGDFTVTHNTVLASNIIERSVSHGNRVLFLAHRRELISQAFRKIIGCSCRAGYEHDSLLPDPLCKSDGLSRKMVGVLMASDPRRNPGAVVQVASIDTLRNRAKPPANLIIVDEAHRTLALSYRAILSAYLEAAVIGLTATPYRADNRSLGEEYDDKVIVATPQQLIDDGFLVEPRVFTVPPVDLADLSRVRIKGGDYDPRELGVAMNTAKLIGDIVDHWKRRAENRQTVVFASDVNHSRSIAARFVAAGIAAEHLDANTPTAERDAILARVERGETRVVSSCDVLSEGWDQPIVKCAILAAPTKSKGKYLQRAGRILRPYENLTALILDHAGCVLDHGLPQETQDFSDILAPAKKKRPVATTCKTCPVCFAIVPLSRRVCASPKLDGTACDYEWQVVEPEDKTEEKDGELVEVRPATMEEKRADWDKICQQAIAKGYQPGWAKYRFKEKFGTWPPNSFSFPERPKVIATDDEKRAKLEELRTMSVERGYKPGWISIRYRAAFGEEPPAEWLAPRMPMAVGDDVSADDFYANAPEPALEEWPF